MPNADYPRDLLPPGRVVASKIVRRLLGPASLNDFAQEQSGASGRWKITLSDLPVWRPDQIKVWRALDGKLAKGWTVTVPLWDERNTNWGGAPSSIAHSDGTYFSDGSGYAWSDLVAKVTSPAAVRAFSIDLQIINGPPLVGGEYFSIPHPTVGERLYLIDGINAEDGAGNYTVSFWPALREGLHGGEDLNFAQPRLVCRLMPDSRMDDERVKEIITRRTVGFVEAPLP